MPYIVFCGSHSLSLHGTYILLLPHTKDKCMATLPHMGTATLGPLYYLTQMIGTAHVCVYPSVCVFVPVHGYMCVHVNTFVHSVCMLCRSRVLGKCVWFIASS